MSGKYRLWKPFEKANAFRGGIEGLSPDDFLPEGAEREVWINNLYQVEVVKHYRDGECGFIKLSFKSQDGYAVHDWRDMQRIKNELAGEEWTGLEIFPPERFLVDTANQFFIWCYKDIDIPFMFKERLVTEAPNGPYGSQRPWPKNEKPPDLKSAEDLAAMLDEFRQEKGTA